MSLRLKNATFLYYFKCCLRNYIQPLYTVIMHILPSLGKSQFSKFYLPSQGQPSLKRCLFFLKKKVRSDVNLKLMKNSASLSNRPKTKNSSTDRTLNQLEIERLFTILLL